MRLVFWQQLPSPHQAPFIREVAAKLGPGGVTCVFSCSRERTVRPLGLELGWEQLDVDYGLADVVYAYGNVRSVATSLAAAEDSVHICSSLAPDQEIRAAYHVLINSGRTIGLLSEARDWRGWRGLLRRADSHRHERTWKRHVSFVLGMGAMGCRWYVLCGYDSSLLFDFSYVVETPNDVAPLADVGGDLRVVFVGQLIARKRVDLLLHAIAKMRQRRIVLDIVGAGPLDGRLRKLAQDLQIQDVVHFLGGLRNTEVRRVLSTADALVLPSHWDGWGAVINEALCNGARVVCSDFCGAADLVSDPRFGSVFRDGSLGSLTHAMTAVADLGKVSVSERALIRSYSERFSGPAVAEYLLSVVEWALRGSGERPLAPWRRLVGKVG